jgi:hypothetical protein
VHGKADTTTAVRKAGGMKMSFKAPDRGVLTIRWYATIKRKKTLIGSGSDSVSASGATTITVHLNAAGKNLLKTAKTVNITETSSFTPKGGKVSTATKTITLKR